MNRIIINNKCDFIDDSLAMKIVKQVIDKGKISKTKKGCQYCFLTNYDITSFDGSFTDPRKVHVYCEKRKNSFSFQIYEEEHWQPVPWSKN